MPKLRAEFTKNPGHHKRRQERPRTEPASASIPSKLPEPPPAASARVEWSKIIVDHARSAGSLVQPPTTVSALPVSAPHVRSQAAMRARAGEMVPDRTVDDWFATLEPSSETTVEQAARRGLLDRAKILLQGLGRKTE
ncbi:MAG: hypothetical protein HYX27_09550 [Acidobacteria bacterium]|nr:hypothetical protein [Acidobacteriota bacterium]